MKKRKTKTRPVVGWREWVLLPDLSPVPMKAKVDTGARTSALHAFDLSVVTRDGEQWAEFEIHPLQRSRAQPTRVACPVVGFRRVRSSTGHAEMRPVIRTPLHLGQHAFAVDVTLTSRDEMGFRMLLGRAAMRRRFWVDPARSFIHATPPPSADGEGEQRP